MQTLRFFFACLFLAALASCGKKETAPQTASNMSIDTTKKAQAVAITDTSHHLFFRPKAGSVQRYHIVDRLSMSTSDSEPGAAGAAKHTASSTTEIYLHQTVKNVRRDSSVELVLRVDSVRLTSQRDTTKTEYSSTNPKDTSANEFEEFKILMGKNFSILTNKNGDLDSITDVSSLTNALLKSVPDSERTNPQVLRYATEQAEQVASAYIMRVLVHSPTRALIQDTTWRSASDVNLDVAQGLSFPVHIDATETVRGLEKRDNLVLAVLEDSTTTTPRKRVFDEGPTTATISDFRATSRSVVRIEDATGLLYHRAMTEMRNFTIVVESKEHAGEKRTVTQHGSEELVTERIE